MKTLRDILTNAVILAIPFASAHAISLPVAEDTFSSPHGTLTAASGKATTLLLNTNQAALVKFDLASLPAAFNATNIASARLKIYIVTTRTPGDIVVTLITSAWTEAVITNTPMPSFDISVIGMVSAARVLPKHFVSVDVTASVVAALAGNGPDFGFLLHDTRGQTYIPSKEGPSQGPSMELEIDANLALDVAGGATFPGSVNVGGNLGVTGLSRQGSENGTAQPAGRGIITRRLESTNASVGSVVARTDTITLERDGTAAGWRVVNVANPRDTTVAAIAVHDPGFVVGKDLVLPSDSAAGTNTLFSDDLGVLYFRCTFSNAADVGHQTEVSLTRSPDNGGTNWIGFITSTYNQ